MKLRLLKQWQLLRESLWFVPGLLVLVGLALALGLVRYDALTTPGGLKRLPLFFGIGADASRNMLTAIAGSMLTVATLAFSVTLAALSQISNQYSPRVLRNFMRDEVNQVVMGYFMGVFAYCLTVLGTIRGLNEGRGEFVPSTAVLGGLLLALGGVAALIFFIHHMAESLQTGTLVRHITNDTLESMADMFPDDADQADPPAPAAPLPAAAAARLLSEPAGWLALPAPGYGYLQRIDVPGLVAWARRHGALLRLDGAVGAFVGEGTPLFSVRPDLDAAPAAPAPPGAAPREWPLDLMDYVSIGRHRNIEQDVAFGLQQLVDIALKALSIGINDTTTAIMAIDHLGEIGARLARQPFPAPLHCDERAQPRLLVRYPSFADYIGLAFNLVRINARGNFAVLRRLLRALSLIAGQVREPGRKAVLGQQAALLLAQADATLETDYEKELVRALYEELRGGWE